ncbi:hypothetical protein LF1_27790 [Rubripirellula obstinata]|uniref:DUF1553 domain-containing protein n=1 Tax=Rubripirellula obstinata TaxID=406547 RepID=A0A5B1CL38_9BACT|nr:DUF1549 and DUF1553 domain-containing protein [Rubripirellula obstinata]KAA1260240.1 hypothetical protein LF1_27790 [Rubripirellula obstinata]
MNPNDDQTFVRQRLDSIDQPKPIDPKFVERLSDRLDAEFVTVSSDGSKSRGIGEVFPVDAKRTGRMLRWPGSLAAAAIFLGMFSFWIGQPLTSWAEMIEALRSTPWVQTDSGRTSSWFSASNQVMAMRNTNQTVFASQRSGTQLKYVREESRIYQTNAGEAWLPLERELIAWLLASSQGNNDSFSRSLVPEDNFTLVSESARSIDDASGRWLELTVAFESNQQPSRAFTAVFLLDPRTKLPVSCRVHQGALASARVIAPSSWQQVSFDYPSEGPANIFDLGIAADTPIEMADSDSNSGIVSTNPPTAKLAISEEQPAKSEPASTTLSSEDEKPAADATEKNKAVASNPKATAVSNTDPLVPIPDTLIAMTERVDQLLEKLWAENDVVPVGLASDETFLRRVYLDVIGRVPSIAEYDQFFESDSLTRRRELIDKLLDSREHALHLGGVWKRVLVPDDETAISRLGGSGKLEKWLADSFATHQPYDQMVRKLLLAQGRVNESGPLLFYAAAKMNAEELAARTSRCFLGMRMECAECHDHPFDHWSQEDFWGLAAYFAQISRPQGKIEMVSPVLRVRDADFGDVKLPETDVVIPPSLPINRNGEHGMDESDLAMFEDIVATGLSRREQLAAWITHPQNNHFSQATVNRIWAHLFGRGIVDPVDDMGGHNSPVSPELLNQLGRYFVKTDFDLQSLMRVLLNSQAYQLSSENQNKAAQREVNFFARMSLKPLTAEQLYDCLAMSTGRADLGSGMSASVQSKSAPNVDRFSDSVRTAFLAQFRTSIDQRTDYQGGIPQSLTLMNGPMIASVTKDAPKGILRSLSSPFFDDETRIEKLFVATLTRKPTEQERTRYAKFLSSQPAGAQQSETLGDVLWVLLNSTEFTMNH